MESHRYRDSVAIPELEAALSDCANQAAVPLNPSQTVFLRRCKGAVHLHFSPCKGAVHPHLITTEDDFERLTNINISDFQNFFLVGYATTSHIAQGMSIGEPYTIHEWDIMDQRLKHVNLSRSRSY
jgi:hypothetical protein